MIARGTIYKGDCYALLREMPDDSVDCVITSPPYGSQRDYGIDFVKNDAEWVSWTARRYMECLRVSKGLVAFVVEGYTRKGTFHPLPELLTAELVRLGANMRRRIVFQRFGTPGGSPDELAQHHELVICASSEAGKLPYADPRACGHPPKCKPGGKPSSRKKDGSRTNANTGCDCVGDKYLLYTKKCQHCGAPRPQEYKPPKVCKASNVLYIDDEISLIRCGAVGGGNMGSKLATENEAPFPERLVEPILLTYCPPGGTVLDTFCGSGTTPAVALKNGRQFIGFDNRQSQVDLTNRRLEEIRSTV